MGEPMSEATRRALIEQGYLDARNRAIQPIEPKPPVEKSLYVMMAEVKSNSSAKGWRNGTRSFGDLIALLHSEVTEALEAYRIHQMKSYTSPDGKPADVASEFADVLIRLLDACDIYGIDLQAEYERKMAYNRTRDQRHGGKAL